MIKLDFEMYKKIDELPAVTDPKIYANNKHTVFSKEGLYSEQIFGPVNNYKCQCGKIFGRINAGKVCDVCGVECTTNSVRSERFAKIELPENIFIITPIFKNVLKEIFGNSAIKSILNKLAYNTNKEKPYYFSLEKGKLLKENKIRANEKIVHDIPVFDIFSLKKLFDYLKDHKEYIKEDGTVANLNDLINLETGEFKSDEELELLGIRGENIYRHFLTRVIDEEYLPFIFMNQILVSDPNSRQIRKISATKIIPHPISKAYIEILKSISRGTNMLDNLLNENSDFFGNTIYKYQQSVDEIYEEILQFNFQKKDNYVKESLTGKTIEFSQRSVIVPNPAIRPYQISLPKESTEKLFLPELLRFLFVKYQDKEIELIENGNIRKYDIVDYIQYIFDKFNNNFEIEIKDEDFNSFLLEEIENFKMVMERQPNLWKYSISGVSLGRVYGDSRWDEMYLPNLDKFPKEYHYLFWKIVNDSKKILKKLKTKNPKLYRWLILDFGELAFDLMEKKITEIEKEKNGN